jgi:DNA-binding NarL/FixJ family response regulator
MLLEGKTIQETAKEMGLVNSTIERYASSIIHHTQKLNN